MSVPDDASGEDVDGVLQHRRERRPVGDGAQPVREPRHGQVETAEQAAGDHPEQRDAADLDEPEGEQVDDEVAREGDDHGEHDRHGTRGPADGGRWPRHVEEEGTEQQRGHSATDEVDARASEIACEIGDLRVDRSQEVDGDVTGADTVLDLGEAPEVDRAEQRLTPPDERDRRRGVVAADGRAGRRERGEQDRGADEAEDRVRRHPGQQRQPVGRVPPEAGSEEQPEGLHDARTGAGTRGHATDGTARDQRGAPVTCRALVVCRRWPPFRATSPPRPSSSCRCVTSRR